MTKNVFFKTRFLALLMALAMFVSVMPLAAFAEGEDGTDEPMTAAERLQKEINNASDGVETTVTMTESISAMTTDEIITVPEGKVIVLNMAEYSITVDTNFAGRPIVNKGTLTVTGNGTIDSSASKNGYGAIRNDGILTIDNGTYKGNVYGDGAAIRNGIGAELTVYDGYFAATGAIYNVGNATIYKGEFVTLACSGCGTPWAYALNNRDESGASGTMDILPENDDDVKVHGPQGALASVGGAKVYVKGGTFYTEPCEKNGHKGSTFYAVYVSGKAGAPAKCVIDGGNFSTTGSNACIYVNNTNPQDNGGEPGQGILEINGGNFNKGNNGATLVKFTGTNGSRLAIAGGKFDVDVTEYVAPGYAHDVSGKVLPQEQVTVPFGKVVKIGDTFYGSLEEAIKEANAATESSGQTIEILDDITVDTWNQMWNIDDVTINGNDHTLTVKKIYSNGNGNYLTYGAKNLTVENLIVDQTNAKNGGFSITDGSKLNNVTVIGGIYGALTGSDVTITDCTFQNVEHAIYTNEDGNGMNVKITNNIFENCRAVILRNDEKFTGNTLIKCASGVTVASSVTNADVSGNTFKEGSRLKVYPGANIGVNAIDFVELSTDISNVGTAVTFKEKPSNIKIPAGKHLVEISNANGTYSYYLGDGVAQIGEKKYATLEAAIAAAQPGDTITLLTDVETSAQIDITKNLTLNGNGKTLTYANPDTTATTKISALQVWNAEVTIKDLTIQHNTGAALLVNRGAKVIATSLATSGNGWGGVNVDKSSTFMATGLTCNEDVKVWSEDAGSGDSTVDIAGYVTVYGVDGTKVHYTTKDVAETKATAKIRDTYYGSLPAAVAAANNGETVTLVKKDSDVTGPGVKLAATDKKNVIIDLNGCIYTVTEAVGSKGYESQGFHFEKDNTVTLENGTIKNSSSSKPEVKIMIQNYCDLTLEGLTIEGDKGAQYGLSCNAGNTTLENVNISGTESGFVALDVMHWHGSYNDAPTVTINNGETNIIRGKVDVYCYGDNQVDTCTDRAKLTITGGKFLLSESNVNNVSAYLAGTDYCQNKESGVVGKHNIVTVLRKEATCTETGVVGGSYCTNCEKEKEAVVNATISALGHDTKGTVPHRDATCTASGVVGGTYCTVCENGKAAAEATIPATGHSWGPWTVERDATETTEGSERRVCETCKTTETRTIPQLGHTHIPEVIPARAPTCTENGLTAGERCSACGNILTEQEIIPALGHDFTTEWTHDETNHWHKCSRCDERQSDSTAAHTWDNGVVTTPATTSREGVRTFTCTVCGATRTESIPRREVTVNPPTGGNRPSGNRPNNGNTPSNPEVEINDPEVPLAQLPLFFVDVPETEWFRDPVAYVFNKGLMTGVTDTYFQPYGDVTRGMMATLLYRMAGEPGAGSSTFADVAADMYYYTPIAWGSAVGVVKGYMDTEFRPNNAITRQDLAVMLYRYAQLKGYDTSRRADLTGYADQMAIYGYAREAMEWAVAEGLMNGVGDNWLAPNGTASRSQAAMLLMRFCENIAK